jgi:hypothetical protein
MVTDDVRGIAVDFFGGFDLSQVAFVRSAQDAAAWPQDLSDIC